MEFFYNFPVLNYTMIKYIRLALFSLFLPVLAAAQSTLPANMFLQKLSNGLDVLVIEDNSVPLATVMLTCKNGSYTESPQYNGLSHLYEHMFFKANKDYDSQEEFLSRISELGMRYNGGTQYENVNYYFTLPKTNLKEGLKFMNSAIRYPKFDPAEMKKENEVVDDEFQRQESNPLYALNDAMSHHMWGDLYSRKNIIGDHNVIRNATPALMDSIKNKYYFPNNMLLTVAGDVQHDDVFSQVEKIYGSWKPSGFDPFKKWPIPEFTPLQKKDCFVVESKLAQVPEIKVEWMGPDTRTDVPATYTADVFSFILDQTASKLNKALVQSGLALQIDFGYITLNHVGPIELSVIPNPDKINECMTEIKRQIDQWDAGDYFTDEQLKLALRKMEIRQVREQEVTSDYVQALSFWWASTSLDYFMGYNDNMQKVTRADLQNYVRKYLKGRPYCAGLLINPDKETKTDTQQFTNAN